MKERKKERKKDRNLIELKIMKGNAPFKANNLIHKKPHKNRIR